MNFSDEIDPPGFFHGIPGEIQPNTSGWVEFPIVFPVCVSYCIPSICPLCLTLFNYIPMIFL